MCGGAGQRGVPLYAQSGGSFRGKGPLLHHAPSRKWVMSLRLWDYRPSGRRVPGCFLAVMFRPCSARRPPPSPRCKYTHTHTHIILCYECALHNHLQLLRNGNSKCTQYVISNYDLFIYLFIYLFYILENPFVIFAFLCINEI